MKPRAPRSRYPIVCGVLALGVLLAGCSAHPEASPPRYDPGTNVAAGVGLAASRGTLGAPPRPTLDRSTPRRGGIHAEHGASGDLPPVPDVAVDADAGYAFVRHNGATITVDALVDGHAIRTLTWDGPMTLDAASHRLYIDHDAEPALLTIIDTRSLERVGGMPLPARRETSAADARDASWGERQVAPVLLPTRGSVLVFRGGVAQEVDPASGTEGPIRLVPFPDLTAPIRQALGSPDGGTLFVAANVVDDPVYDLNTRIAALDVVTGRTLWSQTVFGHLTFHFTWGDRLLTAAHWGQGDGANLYVWDRNGLAVRSEGWPTRIHSAFHDRADHRIVVWIDQFIEQDILAVLDDEGLDLRHVVDAPTNADLIGRDDAADHWLLDAGDTTLVVDNDVLLFPPVARTVPQAPGERSYGRSAVSPGWPEDRSIVRATVFPDAVLCFGPSREHSLAVSDDLGTTWQSIHAGLPTCHDEMHEPPVLAPSFPDDRMMFLRVPRLGVFRYDRSDPVWRPASDGLRALSVQDLVLSPRFEVDRTLIALSKDRGAPINAFAPEGAAHLATAWISRDAGDGWSALGDFDAIAFSADPRTPRRLYAFREGATVLEVSDDFGATWRESGRPLWTNGDERPEDQVVAATAIRRGANAADVLFVRIAARPDRIFEGTVLVGSTLVGSTLRSTDRGQTWHPIDVGMPEARSDRLRFERAGGRSTVLWTGWTWNEGARRNFIDIWRSDDDGATWRTLQSPSVGGPIRAIDALPGGGLLITDDDERFHVLPLDALVDAPIPEEVDGDGDDEPSR
ncbi:MAG: sialidase family protein [Ardenticatenales bacterium]